MYVLGGRRYGDALFWFLGFFEGKEQNVFLAEEGRKRHGLVFFCFILCARLMFAL